MRLKFPMLKFAAAIGLWLTLGLVSCNTFWTLESPCDKINQKEASSQIIDLLVRQNFKVTNLDTANGYIEAELMPSSWDDLTDSKVKHNRHIWTFQCTDSSMLASAEYHRLTLILYYIYPYYFIPSQSLMKHYIGDDAEKSSTWYWSIRNGLKKIWGENILLKKWEAPIRKDYE